MDRRTAQDSRAIAAVEPIDGRILVVRRQRVILDGDLAGLYGVSTRRLNEQLRRNLDRFPADFAFRLSAEEFADLKSHFATSTSGWGGRRKLPYAFTEHGVVMAANILNSAVAVRASIQVVRAFVRLRQSLSAHQDLARKLEELERKYASHDAEIKGIFQLVKKLMEPSPPPHRRRIGFIAESQSGSPTKR